MKTELFGMLYCPCTGAAGRQLRPSLPAVLFAAFRKSCDASHVHPEVVASN